MKIANQNTNSLQEDFSGLPPLLNTKQTADALGVTQQTVRKLLRTGELQGRMVGKYYRVPRANLITYLSEGGDSNV